MNKEGKESVAEIDNHRDDSLLTQNIEKALGLVEKCTWRRIVGGAGLITSLLTIWLGLWVTPSAELLGQTVRLLYVHPPVAWSALYLAFGTTTVASMLWLWPRTRSYFWDDLAGASGEVGVLLLALTLVTGSIWGRTTWGLWWTWDARLTLTAVLLVLYLGYLALRAMEGNPKTKATRNAIFALVAAIDVPVVHFSVDWWNTLHQKASVLTPGLHLNVHGSIAYTMGLGFLATTLLWVWMVRLRYEIAILEKVLASEGRNLSLKERISASD